MQSKKQKLIEEKLKENLEKQKKLAAEQKQLAAESKKSVINLEKQLRDKDAELKQLQLAAVVPKAHQSAVVFTQQSVNSRHSADQIAVSIAELKIANLNETTQLKIENAVNATKVELLVANYQEEKAERKAAQTREDEIRNSERSQWMDLLSRFAPK